MFPCESVKLCLSVFKGLNMALSFLLVLAATVILIRPETPVTKVGLVSKLSVAMQLPASCQGFTGLIICLFVQRHSTRIHLSVVEISNTNWTPHVQMTPTVNQVICTVCSLLYPLTVHFSPLWQKIRNSLLCSWSCWIKMLFMHE